MPLNIGQLVRERYQILALLGQGGMGAVYRAFDQRDQRPCAIKEMCPAPDLAPDKLAGLRDQFRREASILATLRHTGLTRVSDYFVEGENEYLSLALKPAQRFQSASEMLAALDWRSSRASLAPPLWAWVLLGVVVLILLCAVVTLGVLVVMAR